MFIESRRRYSVLSGILFIALTAYTARAGTASPTAESVTAQANNEGWTTVTLTETFVSPVVVCTPQYDPVGPPAVVRVLNPSSTGFGIQLARLDGKTERIDYAVRCLAVEKGVYTEPEHGVKMEAGHYLSIRTDRAGSFVGRKIKLQNSYSRGVVLGQVATAQDPNFSVFWSKPSSGTTLGVQGDTVVMGKQVLEDPTKWRRPEVVGYIITEAGAGTLGNLDYEAGHSPLAAQGPDDGPPATRPLSSLTNASSAVLSSWGMLGANGAYPVLAGTQAVQPSSLTFFMDEDQLQDPERNHISESVAFLAVAPSTPPPPPEITLQMSPTTVELRPSQSQTFAVTATGGDPGPLQWMLSAPIGSLAASDKTAVYVAPSTITGNATVEVKAVSSMDPNKIFATALISLLPTITTSITPESIQLREGEATQFSASVDNTANQEVRWSIDQPIGTITQNGLYTAPPTLMAQQTIEVKATPVDNAENPGSAVVNLTTTPRVDFTIDKYRLSSLTYNGRDFYFHHDYLVQGAVFRSADGSETDTGWIRPQSAVLRNDHTSFEHVYNQDQPHQFTVKVVWKQLDKQTLKADIYVTNNDPTNDLARITLGVMGITLPDVATNLEVHSGVHINSYSRDPVKVIHGSWGSLAVWQDYPTPAHIWSHYNASEQTGLPFKVSNFNQRTSEVPGQSFYYEDPIAPGQTRRFTQYVRFDEAQKNATELAPEALASFRKAFPSLVHWQDRRPIANWFVSEGTKRSALNPRGYLWDQHLDVLGNPSEFRSRLLSQADQMITRFNSMQPRPQGVIIWDLEGQEFIHAFTYVGDPTKLPDLAPEMDAVADELFARFNDAGYRVGITLRPTPFMVGTDLPGECRSDADYIMSDKFIKLDAPFPYRGYVCTESDTWTQAPANQPYEQSRLFDDDELFLNLRQKVEYAVSRWNTTLFYVDTNLYHRSGPIAHTIFRRLMAEFPGCLFIPEWENNYYWGTSAPYNEADMGVLRTWDDIREVYPDAFSVINIADVDPVGGPRDALVNGVRSGDILLFRGWFTSSDISVVESIYSEAAQ